MERGRRPCRTSFQIHDAAFGFDRSEQYQIHEFVPALLGGTQAVSVFHDEHLYYYKEAPYNSVKISQEGLMFSLLNTSPDRSAIQVSIHYSASQNPLF